MYIGLIIGGCFLAGMMFEKYIFPILDLRVVHYANTYSVKTAQQNCDISNIHSQQKLKNISTQKDILNLDFDIALIERDIDDVRGREIEIDGDDFSWDK